MNILTEKDKVKDFRETLCNLINANNCKDIAEIGVWKGELSRMILDKCNPNNLILVDPLDYKLNNKEDGYVCNMGEPLKTQEDLDKIAKEIDKLPATFYRMTSMKAVKNIEDESLDFVFIDGMHTYEAVKEDIKAWLPKIKKGGILSGDDYRGKHSEEVSRAVNGLLKNNDKVGEIDNIARTWFVEII